MVEIVCLSVSAALARLPPSVYRCLLLLSLILRRLLPDLLGLCLDSLDVTAHVEAVKQLVSAYCNGDMHI